MSAPESPKKDQTQPQRCSRCKAGTSGQMHVLSLKTGDLRPLERRLCADCAMEVNRWVMQPMLEAGKKGQEKLREKLRAQKTTPPTPPSEESPE